MSKWNSKRKEFNREQVEKPIYIFCGGEKTEYNYFSSFKYLIESSAMYKNLIKIEILVEPSDTIRILDKSIEYIKKNKINKADVWCVFDKDDFSPVSFNNSIYKASSLNQTNDSIKYYIAWSNECIELWFLLHFCYYHVNNGRKDYIDKLNEYLSNNKNIKYAKNNKEIFNLLLTLGMPKEAISRAKKLIKLCEGKTPSDSAPCTTVHLLVEFLAKYLQDDMRIKFIDDK